jgi:hypothetical protein
MKFVNDHPWMTFFLALAGIGAVSAILSKPQQSTQGLVGAGIGHRFLPPQYGIQPQYATQAQYTTLPQYTQAVQHQGHLPTVRGNILYRAQ